MEKTLLILPVPHNTERNYTDRDGGCFSNRKEAFVCQRVYPRPVFQPALGISYNSEQLTHNNAAMHSMLRQENMCASVAKDRIEPQVFGLLPK